MTSSLMMKSFLIRLSSSWLIFGCLLLNSCTHYYYAPEEGNLLALNEQGDLKASASVGTAFSDYGTNNSYGFQAGYSPWKGVAIQGSFFHINHIYQNALLGNLSIASGAIGTYYSKEFVNANQDAPEKSSKQGLLFDAYLGFGMGDAYNNYLSGGKSNFIFNKVYLQGGIHWQAKWVGLSFIARIVRLDYDRAILTGNIINGEWSSINRIIDNNPYTLVETSSRFHVGNKHFKVYLSQSTVYPQFVDYEVDYLIRSLSIGAVLDIDSLFAKKSSKKKKKLSKKKKSSRRK